MVRFTSCLAAAGALALSGCVAPPPTGPSVMAMPAQGKSFDTFRQDDAVCRQYAAQQTGYTTPGQAATDSAVGSTVLGTVAGAAAGAAIGAAVGNPAAGAAIGAGAGFVGGSSVGAANAQMAGGAVQQRYDMAYIQCMAAKGESVPTATAGGPPSPPPGAYPPGYPPYAAYPPYGPYPYYYGPPVGGAVIIGGYPGWGYGYGYHRHW